MLETNLYEIRAKWFDSSTYSFRINIPREEFDNEYSHFGD